MNWISEEFAEATREIPVQKNLETNFKYTRDLEDWFLLNHLLR